jgi:hypothetical protein
VKVWLVSMVIGKVEERGVWLMLWI